MPTPPDRRYDDAMTDARILAQSTARNRDPILAVLREWLPPTGLVLEIASGAGEHAVHAAAAMPGLTWRPTDRDETALASIAAWRAASGLSNIAAPQVADAADPDAWPVDRADAIVNINMIHISPWAATLGLLKGAGRVLGQGGVLYLYGPYRERGRQTAPSNEAFDASLKSRNPAWGLRELETVAEEAARCGLTLAARVEMPANNLSVVFRKM
jgi:SAM-dependent methyltransferase